MSSGVIIQHESATPTQHTLDTCCHHFSGNFWTIHPILLTVPNETKTCVHRSHNNEEVDTAVHEWLQMPKPNFCHDGIF